MDSLPDFKINGWMEILGSISTYSSSDIWEYSGIDPLEQLMQERRDKFNINSMLVIMCCA